MAQPESAPSFFEPNLMAEIERLGAQDHPDLMAAAADRLASINEYASTFPVPEKPSYARLGAKTALVGGAIYYLTRSPEMTGAYVTITAAFGMKRRRYTEAMQDIVTEGVSAVCSAQARLSLRRIGIGQVSVMTSDSEIE